MSKSFYNRDLPHFLPNDRPYFLTFRLAGSDPVDEEALQQLAHDLKFVEYDRMLDSIRTGPHYLSEPRVASVVQEALHFRDGRDYTLLAYTIMSNHVHLVFSLAFGAQLPEVMRRLKSWTARECNRVLEREGEFWQHEGYDHVARRGSLGAVVAYVLNNPVKAGIVANWRDYPWTYLNPDLHGFE